MYIYSLRKTSLVSFLSVLVILTMLPFSFSASLAASPIGKVACLGTVSIEGSAAPTGTVVLSGERIAAQQTPALVTLQKGGSVLLNEGAAATFSRNGNMLLVKADKGTISFNFPAGEAVRINAGSRNYVASESGSAGVITVASNVAPVISVASGSVFATVNAVQGAKGNLTKGGSTFTDPSANWKPGEWNGKYLNIGGKSYKIVSNTGTTLKIEGDFAIDTGSYGYEVGAKITGPGSGAGGGGTHAGMGAGTKALIVVAVAGGATGGIIAATSKSD
jgi:hypothetical protein